MKEILFVKASEFFGYKKITAIKDTGFVWNVGERDSEVFGILKTEMSESDINAWSNENKFCVSEDEKSIIETPKEYQCQLEP